MQKSIRALGVAAVLLLTTAAAHADLKIAAVREDVLQNAPQLRAVQAQMQAEFDKRRAAIESQGKQLADDIQKYQRDAATMSLDQKDKTEKDLNTRKAQLDYDQRKAQEDLQTHGQELQAAAISKVRDVILQVGKEKGYDIVINGAFIINSSIDITDEVLKRLAAQGGAAVPAGK